MEEKAFSRIQSYIRKIYAGVPQRYEKNKTKSKQNIEKHKQKMFFILPTRNFFFLS